MRNLISSLALAIIFSCCVGLAGSEALSAGFKDAKIAFKSGNWTVLRSIDSMNDTVSCTGIYKENYGIQLIKDMLFVSVKGGLESVTLRFSDKPAHPLRLSEEMEKKVHSIIISGSDFSELIESDRLRIMASTLISGIVNEDLDLSGIKDALESIKTDCHIQANASPTPKSEKPSASACTDVLVSRMKAEGLKESQIFAICK